MQCARRARAPEKRGEKARTKRLHRRKNVKSAKSCRRGEAGVCHACSTTTRLSLVPQVFQAREAVPRAPAHKVGTRHAPRLRQRRVERCERLHLARLAERPG